MARKRAKATPGEALGQVIFTAIVIWAVVQFIQGDGDVVIGAIAIGAVLLIAALATYMWWKQKSAERLAGKIEQVINRHIDALLRRRAQLVILDAYGKPQTHKWERELQHFIKEHVADGLDTLELEELKSNRTDVERYINERVTSAAKDNPAFQEFSWDMSPQEFEAFCAEKLKRLGWTATLTSAGADQGVDIVAEKNGIRLVVQCKLWTQPVGNAAVQEIAAARAHESAHHAAVVTNSSYTDAARQLAASNHVVLLHFSEIEILERECIAISRSELARSANGKQGTA